MPNKIVKSIPNTITLCNLLSGCVAVYMAFHSSETFGSLTGMQWAWIWIGIAAVFDFCDGAAARLLKAFSNIGGELDSLADLVSFGVAPGMMILNLMQANSQCPWLGFAAMLIPMFGALRLAKFNVDTTQSTVFRGLPIPANALFWIGLCGWVEANGYPGHVAMMVLIVLLSWLMVCNLRMFSLKFKNFDWRDNFRRYILILAAVMFVVVWGVAGFAWLIVLYVFISALGRKEQIEA